MNKEEAIKYLQQLYPNGGHCWLDEQRIEAIGMAVNALQEEPVSEDLEDTTQTITYDGEIYTRCYKDKLDAFACKYHMSVPKTSKKYAKYSDVDLTIAVKKGAQWQKEQFEKERLKHCDELTNEQAELEQGFIDQHLDKHQRMPTFLDAIEYGMRLQKKEMMTKSIEAVVSQVPYSNEIILYNPCSVDKYYLPQEMNKLGLNKGDKVKLVIIKED